MSGVLQRPSWSGVPVKGGDFFIVRQQKDGASQVAVCELWSHIFGWELRMLIDGELRGSQVCHTGEEWLETGEQWRAVMIEKGWRVIR
jgi:hypothetical protein